jgi:hypothetical protein
MLTDNIIIAKESDFNKLLVPRKHLLANTYGRLWMAGMLAVADMGGMLLAVLIAFNLRMLPGLLQDLAY